MIEVTDDLLNKFIEGELDSDSVKEITDAVNKNEELRIRLNALQKVHEELKKIKIKETRSDFTSLIYPVHFLNTGNIQPGNCWNYSLLCRNVTG